MHGVGLKENRCMVIGLKETRGCGTEGNQMNGVGLKETRCIVQD